MSRAHRTLRRVRIADAEQAATIFELLMGNDVAPRKDFIIAGQGLDLSRVDV
jgi:DNA gyrase subunit B